jgi:hypothetical protein
VFDLEWWLRDGWYQLGVVEFAAVLILAAVWLWVAAHQFVFRRTRDRRGRGLLIAMPIIAWAVFAYSQALNGTQIAMAGGYSRYPSFWMRILASALVGFVVSCATFATDRLLAAPGPYGGPSRGVARCNKIAFFGWATIWVAVFLNEMAL